MDEANFCWALAQLKAGKKVARKGWNGKNMFLYLVCGSKVDIVNLSDEAAAAFNNVSMADGIINICPHIDMKTVDGSIVVGWLASQTDMLSTDWEIID